jgi:hypothetical protein
LVNEKTSDGMLEDPKSLYTRGLHDKERRRPVRNNTDGGLIGRMVGSLRLRRVSSLRLTSSGGIDPLRPLPTVGGTQ